MPFDFQSSSDGAQRRRLSYPSRQGPRSGWRAETARRIGAARGRPTSFVGEVHQAIRRAGGNPNRDPGTGKGGGRFNARGRGAATALRLKDRSAWSRDGSGARTRARRVAVKARVVKLNPQRGAARGRQFVSAKAVDAHLRYLERDGVTKDGEKGQVYSAERDVEDGRAFLERGRDDRHQFRFIVSAEDGAELSDPRETTRDLMQQMEADLGTKLDWIAVDHHNTGHPHSHILLRGVTDDGKTLNIAGDYIAYGIRERASEIVTRELGRQTELEVTKQLEREVDADRFTRLDRMLIAEQQGREFSDLRPDQDMRDTVRQNRALLIERARKLERMGLATEIETGKWMVSPKAEPTLRELGERGDIIKAMHRASGARRAGGGPPSRGLRPASREHDRAHHRPRARQRAWRRRDGRAGPAGDRRRGRARAPHRDGRRPRRGRRPRHDRRGRLRSLLGRAPRTATSWISRVKKASIARRSIWSGREPPSTG